MVNKSHIKALERSPGTEITRPQPSFFISLATGRGRAVRSTTGYFEGGRHLRGPWLSLWSHPDRDEGVIEQPLWLRGDVSGNLEKRCRGRPRFPPCDRRARVLRCPSMPFRHPDSGGKNLHTAAHGRSAGPTPNESPDSSS